jgi:hypothetical protein
MSAVACGSRLGDAIRASRDGRARRGQSSKGAVAGEREFHRSAYRYFARMWFRNDGIRGRALAVVASMLRWRSSRSPAEPILFISDSVP